MKAKPTTGEIHSRQQVSLRGRVLLVDDEPINTKVVLAILRKTGMEAEAARTGGEALQMLEVKDYTLVLLDVYMPEMNGFETAKRIRANEKKAGRRRTTIIAMTANEAGTTREQCLAAGMDDFLTKPVQLEDLAARMIPLLDKNNESAGPRPVSTKAGTPGAVPAGKLWSRTQSLDLLGGDEALFGELATVFIGRNELLLENIVSAVEDKDPEALQDAAHAYKGAVGHFASRILRESAMALEMLAKEGQLDGVAGHVACLLEKSRLLCSELRQVTTVAEDG